jgi:hypothetical protein
MELKFKPNGYLLLTNSHGIEIEINDSCDGVRYKYTGDKEPKEAEIIPLFDADDEENRTEMGFVTEEGNEYFLNQFMRYDFGK